MNKTDNSVTKHNKMLVINKQYTEEEISLLLAAPINRRLEILNQICGVTTKDVCNAINVSVVHYYRLTSGKNPISATIARKLANLFKVKIEFFGVTDGERDPQEQEEETANEFFDRRAFLLYNNVSHDTDGSYLKHIYQTLSETSSFREKVFPQNFSMIASDVRMAKMSIYPDDIIELMYIADGKSVNPEELLGQTVRTVKGDYGILGTENGELVVRPLNTDFSAVKIKNTGEIEAFVISVKHISLSCSDLLRCMFDKNSLLNK